MFRAVITRCGLLAQDVPCLRLKVLPAAVLQNCTGHVVTLECGGGVSASADPLTDEPMAWWPLRQRPRKGTLSTRTAGGIRLASDAFPLEPGDTLLALRSQTLAGMVLALGMSWLHIGGLTPQPLPVLANQNGWKEFSTFRNPRCTAHWLRLLDICCSPQSVLQATPRPCPKQWISLCSIWRCA